MAKSVKEKKKIISVTVRFTEEFYNKLLKHLEVERKRTDYDALSVVDVIKRAVAKELEREGKK